MIFLEPKKELTDPVEIGLLYYQAVSDLISGKIPCTEQEARLFAATKLQNDVGDYDNLRTIEELLPNLLSKQMLSAQTSVDWCRQILSDHQKLSGYSQSDCQVLYLNMAKELRYYGSNFFPVQFIADQQLSGNIWSDLPERFDLAVNCDGIYFLDKDTRSEIRYYSYLMIIKWNWRDNKFELQVVDNTVTKQISLVTHVAYDIQQTLSTYARYLTEHSEYGKAIEDYDVTDPELLAFERGDIILIREKHDAQWYYGETNGKRGLFPVEKVTLLIGKPDTKDVISQNKRRSGLPPGADQLFTPKAGSGSAIDRSSGGTIGANAGRALPTPARRATIVGGGMFDQPRLEPKKEVLMEISPDGSYAFLDWAQVKFRDPSGAGGTIGKSSASRRVKKGKGGTMTKEQMIEFSPEPIDESLNKDDQINKLAVESFLSIMKFMDDFPKGKTEKFVIAEELVQRAIEERPIRDEIYCQLMKQTTKHPKKENRKKGMRLLSICLACFAPSPEFTPYLNTWLFALNSDPEMEIPLIAQECQTRLEKICSVGDRFWACSRDEMTSIVTASPIVLRAEMLDGNIKTVTIESHTNVQQAVAIIISKLSLADACFEGWGLFEKYGDDTYPLAETQNVCDIKSGWHMYHNKHSKNAKLLKDIFGDKMKYSIAGNLPDGNRSGELGGFVFKKKIWTTDDTPPDDLINNSDSSVGILLYRQIIDDFLNSRLMFDMKTSLEFSAYHVAATLGGVKDLNTSNYMEFVPRHLKGAKKAVEWVSKISDSVNYEIGNVSGKEAQRALLTRWQSLENYGDCGFVVYQKDKSELPNKVLLMINSESVRLYSFGSSEVLIKWSISSISQWNLTQDGWTMMTGDLFKPESYSFSSPWSASIYDLYFIYATTAK
eukprot:TRINITY_DN634_c0_g1_i1.p1 TRINITY_DN634_c0_g1~~TRINITY_DN634_c0_g1_i1.p1  ORF type:complete len:888 (+),score=230.79 TRINITY_DN634_c0_g1_i1:239-2902(+)